MAHRPIARYVKVWVAHAPGMPGTFLPPPRVSYPDMHNGKCVTHVPGCMLGSLTSGFLWNGWREKRSRHTRRTRNPQLCVSGKRPMSPGVYCWDHHGQITAHHLKKRVHLDLIYGDPVFKWAVAIRPSDTNLVAPLMTTSGLFNTEINRSSLV